MDGEQSLLWVAGVAAAYGASVHLGHACQYKAVPSQCSQVGSVSYGPGECCKVETISFRVNNNLKQKRISYLEFSNRYKDKTSTFLAMVGHESIGKPIMIQGFNQTDWVTY